MATQPVDVDVDIEALSPEGFAHLVHDSDDETIRATFRAVGTSRALDRIFAIMPERYIASGAHATVQWRITDDGETFPYVVDLRDDQCITRAGTAGDATATLTTDLARFARLAAGQASGVKLLMTRRLRASGDVNFARKLQSMFDIPIV